MPRRLALPLLLLLMAPVYLYTAAGNAILDDGDALYAHVAQQMLQRDDWVTPYADGVRFLDKPPMMYWLMALAYRTAGMTEFAARLPSALAVIGIACLLYFMGRKAVGEDSGFIAAIAAAFCVGTFLFTRMVFPDILFVFLLTLALAAFLEWYTDERGPAGPALLFYAALAGAVLTKGLIGLLFPAAIVGLFVLRLRAWPRLLRFHIGKGAVLFLALALPWHLLAARRNPGFLWYFFVNEQFLRFLGRRQPLDYESISVPAFWALILVWLFPWTAFLPALRSGASSIGKRGEQPRALVVLSTSWAAVVLVFFTVSSRIEHYSLPVLPPLALLIGAALAPAGADEVLRRRVQRGFAALAIAGAGLALLTAAGALMWLRGWEPEAVFRGPAGPHLAAYRNYFAPLFDLPANTLARLLRPLAGTCAAFSIGLVAAWWVNRRGRRIPAVLVLCATMMSFCYFAFKSLGACEEFLSSKQFGTALAELYRPGDSAVAVGDFETANSVNFYSPVYGGSAALLEWGLRYPDAPQRILSVEDLVRRWNGPARTFVLTPDDLIPTLPLPQYSVILRSAGRSLLCNRAAGL
jgi:4-amino-4-deoxy-L-arabinose transferase-like glycosyltransferase